MKNLLKKVYMPRFHISEPKFPTKISKALYSIRLNHNQGSTDFFAMLQTLNLRLTPFIVAIMMLNHATTPPVSVI